MTIDFLKSKRPPLLHHLAVEPRPSMRNVSPTLLLKTRSQAYTCQVRTVRAFTAVELKSYNAILAPLIYQKHLAAVVVKQNFFADLLQCTSIDRCAL